MELRLLNLVTSQPDHLQRGKKEDRGHAFRISAQKLRMVGKERSQQKIKVEQLDCGTFGDAVIRLPQPVIFFYRFTGKFELF